MAYLIQKNTDGSLVKQWELEERPLVFGRAENADAPIADEEMSRRHFSVECQKGEFLVADLQSTNGTFVNGTRVDKVQLQPNDRIKAGKTLFIFSKGLSTMIGELAREPKGFRTQIAEISRQIKT